MSISGVSKENYRPSSNFANVVRPERRGAAVGKQAVGWMSGAVSAVAAAGRPALLAAVGVGALVLALICWTIVDHDRTRNLVAILSALRGSVKESDTPDVGGVGD